MRTINILGYAVAADSVKACVEAAWTMLTHDGQRAHAVVCANPHSLVTANSDSDFRTALLSADLLLPDGAGILLGARLLGLDITERIAGMDFFMEFSQVANARGGARYFFLGSTPRVLDALKDRLARDFPNIVLAGTYSPPFATTFSAEQDSAMVQAINASGANVLWVGMTAPKQEKWIHQHLAQLQPAVVGAVGAVFDFYSGSKKRAPQWICDLGLEWLPRFLREPGRLWRRNFVSTPQYLGMIACARLRGIASGKR